MSALCKTFSAASTPTHPKQKGLGSLDSIVYTDA
jgi:hypothetical protein